MLLIAPLLFTSAVIDWNAEFDELTYAEVVSPVCTATFADGKIAIGQAFNEKTRTLARVLSITGNTGSKRLRQGQRLYAKAGSEMAAALVTTAAPGQATIVVADRLLPAMWFEQYVRVAVYETPDRPQSLDYILMSVSGDEDQHRGKLTDLIQCQDNLENGE